MKGEISQLFNIFGFLSIDSDFDSRDESNV